MNMKGVAALLATALAASAAQAQEVDAETDGTLSIEAGYTSEFWRNFHGGLRRGNAYLDNLNVDVTLDAERAIGVPGTTISVSGLYNNRRTFSDRIVGDLQAVSNIDADGSLRLYEAWIEHEHGPVAVKLGLIDLNSEFDVNETGSLFMNGSHGMGPEFSQVGDNGPGVFPITGLGVRGSLRLTDQIEVRAGLFEGMPGDADHPRRTVLRLDGREGVLVLGEAIFRPYGDLRVAIGAWHHSGHGAASVASPSLSSAVGVYALAETPLADFGSSSLSGFVRLGLADGDSYQLGGYQGAGLVLSGPIFGDEKRARANRFRPGKRRKFPVLPQRAKGGRHARDTTRNLCGADI